MAQTNSIFRVPKMFMVAVFVAVFAGLGAWYFLKDSKAAVGGTRVLINGDDMPVLRGNYPEGGVYFYAPSSGPNVKKLRIVLGQVTGKNLLKATDAENFKYSTDLINAVIDYKGTYPAIDDDFFSQSTVGPIFWKKLLSDRDIQKFNTLILYNHPEIQILQPSTPINKSTTKYFLYINNLACRTKGNIIQFIGPSGFSKNYTCPHTGDIYYYAGDIKSTTYNTNTLTWVDMNTVIKAGNIIEIRELDASGKTISHPVYYSVPNLNYIN